MLFLVLSTCAMKLNFVNLRIQSEYRKIRTRKNYVFGHFQVFSPNTGKYGPKKTPYLDTFHAVWENKVAFFIMENQ